MSDEGKALLCDFGLSAMADGSGLDKSTTLRISGSLQWMAIELIDSDEPGSKITKASDIWSLAMAMVEVRYISQHSHKNSTLKVIQDLD